MAPGVFKIIDLINRLDNLNNTQESIQKTSFWIIHHKQHCDDIVQQWGKSYCQASPKRQLILFYLANDVIQNSKKKNIVGYVDGFRNTLKDACKETDDSNIFSCLNRVLTIWNERSIYEKQFINELRELLYGDDLRLQLTTKIMNEFKPDDLYKLSSEVDKLATQIKMKQQQFNNCKIDISNPDLNRLKDKNYGKHYQEDFDAATRCFKNLADVKKAYTEKLEQYVELLEKAKVFYSVQLKEVINLCDKYQTFEDGTVNVREYILGRRSNSGVTPFSSSKLNSLLASFTGAPVRSLENRLSNILSGNNDLPYDYYDNGYNPYQVTPNTSIDSENHQTTDMDIETSDDEAPTAKKVKPSIEVPYGIPPPPKQPKFQDFFPKQQNSNDTRNSVGSSTQASFPPLPPPPVSHQTSERYDRNLILIPPPPPPPASTSYSPGSSGYGRNHSLQSVVIAPINHHHSQPPPYSHSYEHERDHRRRSSEKSSSRDKRHGYHHHHHHESDKNWKKRKGYNY